MSSTELGNWIDGKELAAAGGQQLDNINPATGEVICKVPCSQAEDVDSACTAARKAQVEWAAISLEQRAEMLQKVAALIDQNAESLARLESEDTGKPISLALAVDIPRAADNFRFFAEFGCQQGEETFPMEDAVNLVRRQAHGVVALITPWNLPLYLLTWKVAPALLCGNSCVCKPSELTPRTATELGRLIQQAGIPDGVYNCIHGRGDEAGAPLVAHPTVKAVSFTGGTKTGRQINATAAAGLKKCSLELGGKNPSVVFADCDFAATVVGVARAAFLNQGQICLSGSRLLVEESIAVRFVEGVVEEVSKLIPGDNFGSLISRQHRRLVDSYVSLARSDGAEILCGGEWAAPDGADPQVHPGAFYQPTVIRGLKPASPCLREEIFGPVLTVQTFKDEAEAVALANDVDYGLSASIWSADLVRAERLADAIDVGMVWVNTWLKRDLRTPFGGTKQSGLGREGGRWSLEFFSSTKNICLPTA